MGTATDHRSARAWKLAHSQHGVIARAQLLALGFNDEAIKHRVSKRRLHRVWRGVYAVGHPDLTREGLFIAAVLRCGSGAALSHDAAAELWGLVSWRAREVEVSVPRTVRRRVPGITAHRRGLRPADVTTRHRIPVTTPVCTLIDLATRHPDSRLERAINTADDLGLANPEGLRRALDRVGRRPGAARLRKLLDHRTFRLTRSELERRFLRIVRRAGLPMPLTKQIVNGFEVDFYWPELGLVVETDSLRYHRTPQQQARDGVRDHAHFAAELIPLRFTHSQVAYEEQHVVDTLRTVAARFSRSRPRLVADP